MDKNCPGCWERWMCENHIDLPWDEVHPWCTTVTATLAKSRT
jgi:hypothetical protein